MFNITGCETKRDPSISVTTHNIPSIQEQLGIDPISRLAAAIERLAMAMERGREDVD